MCASKYSFFSGINDSVCQENTTANVSNMTTAMADNSSMTPSMNYSTSSFDNVTTNMTSTMAAEIATNGTNRNSGNVSTTMSMDYNTTMHSTEMPMNYSSEASNMNTSKSSQTTEVNKMETSSAAMTDSSSTKIGSTATKPMMTSQMMMKSTMMMTIKTTSSGIIPMTSPEAEPEPKNPQKEPSVVGAGRMCLFVCFVFFLLAGGGMGVGGGSNLNTGESWFFPFYYLSGIWVKG